MEKQNKELNDAELLRYSRTIFLDSIDYAGQKKLKNSKALIVGCGGLGSSAAYYLASSGIGQISLCDEDEVEISNLARQIIHTTRDIGKAKTRSAKEKLNALNPEIKITELGKITTENIQKSFGSTDIILDCSDNFETRFLINRFAKKLNIPLVSGAAIRFEAQVMSFLNTKNSACYQCLFPNLNTQIPENCTDCGVFPPLVGVVGSIQASEAIKILLGIGNNLIGKMLVFSLFDMKFKELNITQDKDCKICFPK